MRLLSPTNGFHAGRHGRRRCRRRGGATRGKTRRRQHHAIAPAFLAWPHVHHDECASPARCVWNREHARLGCRGLGSDRELTRTRRLVGAVGSRELFHRAGTVCDPHPHRFVAMVQSTVASHSPAEASVIGTRPKDADSSSGALSVKLPCCTSRGVGATTVGVNVNVDVDEGLLDLSSPQAVMHRTATIANTNARCLDMTSSYRPRCHSQPNWLIHAYVLVDSVAQMRDRASDRGRTTWARCGPE